MITYPASFIFISDEVSQDLAEVLAFAREHGFPGFELRSMFGRAFKDLTREDLARIKAETAAVGLKVLGCATPVFKCCLGDEAQLQAHRQIFQESLEKADLLGCDLVRIFSFLRKAPVSSVADIGQAVACINQLKDLAIPGIRVAVENESSCLVGSPLEIERMLAAGLNPAFGLIWDPCNVLYVPEYRGRATAGYAGFASRVVHVHLKDARVQGATVEAACVGAGEVGWREHLRELAAAGYSGLLSLETHWRTKAIPSEDLHLPGGYAFSVGGREASERCFEAIGGFFPGAGA